MRPAWSADDGNWAACWLTRETQTAYSTYRRRGTRAKGYFSGACEWVRWFCTSQARHRNVAKSRTQPRNLTNNVFSGRPSYTAETNGKAPRIVNYNWRRGWRTERTLRRISSCAWSVVAARRRVSQTGTDKSGQVDNPSSYGRGPTRRTKWAPRVRRQCNVTGAHSLSSEHSVVFHCILAITDNYNKL